MNIFVDSALLAEHIDKFRLPVFITCIVIFGLLQMLFPERRLPYGRNRIVITNLLLGCGGVLCVRVLIPATLVVIATINTGDTRIVGLLSMLEEYANLAKPITIILAIVLLDFAVYWQHRLFHSVQWLWRLHRVHHIDRAIELTTAVRFHPLEIVLSWLFKALLVVILGIDGLSIVLFEMLLSTSALFNHCNLRLPNRFERVLRLILVTPQMHHIHHSMTYSEHNSNYGFCLSIWDRIFASYTQCAKDGNNQLRIGLATIPENGFVGLLLSPFRR